MASEVRSGLAGRMSRVLHLWVESIACTSWGKWERSDHPWIGVTHGQNHNEGESLRPAYAFVWQIECGAGARAWWRWVDTPFLFAGFVFECQITSSHTFFPVFMFSRSENYTMLRQFDWFQYFSLCSLSIHITVETHRSKSALVMLWNWRCQNYFNLSACWIDKKCCRIIMNLTHWMNHFYGAILNEWMKMNS